MDNQISDVEFFQLVARRVTGMPGFDIVEKHGVYAGFLYTDHVYRVMGNVVCTAREMAEVPKVMPAHMKFYLGEGE